MHKHAFISFRFRSEQHIKGSRIETICHQPQMNLFRIVFAALELWLLGSDTL